MTERKKRGAFHLARQIFDSEIWLLKPATWFKIWIYIIGKVNYKDNGTFNRGENFFRFTKELDNIGTDITIDTVRNTLQVPNKKQVLQMINSAIDGDMDMAFEICSNHIINSGFDVRKILRMIDKNLPALELHRNTKGKLIDIISDTEDRINHGGTPDIQMRALLAKFDIVTKVPPECPALAKH